MLATLWQIVLKDLKLFAADRRALLFSIFVPVAIASFMGMLTQNMGVVEKPKPIPILYVDNDHSDVSAKLKKNLLESGTLKLQDSEDAAARSAIRAGNSGVAVVVPKGFGAAATYGGHPDLELVSDPAQALQALSVRGTVVQAAAGAIYGGDSGKVEMPFALKQTTETGSGAPQWDGVAHAFAGMGVQGLLFWAIELAMGLMRERTKGIWRRTKSAPTPMWMHVIGRAVSATLRAMVILLAVFGFGALVFHVRINGSLLGFGLVWVCASTMAATFGLFVASLGKTEQQSRGLAVLVVLTMTMLGGAWFPSFLMPGWVQTVSQFIPVKHAVGGFDAMTWRAQPLPAAVTPALALLGFTAVFLAVALRRFSVESEPA